MNRTFWRGRPVVGEFKLQRFYGREQNVVLTTVLRTVMQFLQ
jgi:hypothetical protein